MTPSTAFSLCASTGDTVFDVGANVGMSAEVLAKIVGPSGVVCSFECHPVHFTKLSFLASMPQFANVRPYCRALSDRPGHTLMFSGNAPEVAQASTIVPDLANANRLGHGMFRLKVETDTLDRFCSALGHQPAFIKIDVEGAEEQVLAGATQTLARNSPHLIFEFGYGWENGGIPGHFTRLAELGYRIFVIDLNYYEGRPASVDENARTLFSIQTADLVGRGMGGNVLAIHETKCTQTIRSATVVPFSPSFVRR